MIVQTLRGENDSILDRAGIWNTLYMQSWREKRIFKVTSAFSETLLCLPVFL